MTPTTGRSITTASLRRGARVGWHRARVEAFAEALIGRPWQRCGRAELESVLLAYAALAHRVRARWDESAAHPEEN